MADAAGAADLSQKLAAIMDCLERSVSKDAASVRDLFRRDYPDMELTDADLRRLRDLMDNNRLLRVLRDASTPFALQVIRVLLDKYGAEDLVQMIRAMR